MAGRRFYEFSEFRLDAAGRVLYRGEQHIPLPPKAAAALLLLVENAGSVVEKEELLRKVWPDTYIQEGGLARTISVLRKVLSDGSGEEYIVTIPKRGYRFAARLEEVPGLGETPARVMLAVLPFENLSGEKKQEYFTDGLTEEMITQLGRLSPERLGVIARTSAMKYKASERSVQQIGKDLGVSHVLQGSVRREPPGWRPSPRLRGGRVRVTAQLIQVSDQTHLWAGGYERSLGDILKLQSEVAQAIAREIEIKLAPQESERLVSAVAVNPQAYEAYLKGRYFWSQRTLESAEKGIRYFEAAIRHDSGYAPAYAGLADSYLTLQDQGYLFPRRARDKAKRAAADALRINEGLAEAHSSLGHAYFHECRWPAAEIEFQRAVELNPNYASAHFYYANFLVALGQAEKAIAEAQRALALDPLSLAAGSNLAILFYFARRFDDSIRQSLKVLEIDPAFPRPYEDMGRVYEQQGKFDRAIPSFQKAVKLSKRNPHVLASLGHCYAQVGKKEEALALLTEIQKAARNQYVSPFASALVFTGLGKKDRAIAWLEKACRQLSGEVPFLKVNPRLFSLHSEPRFQKLLVRLGL